jgi:hypothetical protein
MTRKRRSDKRRYEWSAAAACAALDLYSWDALWRGAEEGRAAWGALSSESRTTLGSRPAPWWAYEPGVPPDLRRMAQMDEQQEDAVLRRRALRWLLAEGAAHLRPGERKAIEQDLAREARWAAQRREVTDVEPWLGLTAG